MGSAGGAATDFLILARRAALPLLPCARLRTAGTPPPRSSTVRAPEPASWCSRCCLPQLAAAPRLRATSGTSGSAAALQSAARQPTTAVAAPRLATLRAHAGQLAQPLLGTPADAGCAAWAAHSAKWRDFFALGGPRARPRNVPRLPRRSRRHFSPNAVALEGLPVHCLALLASRALHRLAGRGMGEKWRDPLALRGPGRGAAKSHACHGALGGDFSPGAAISKGNQGGVSALPTAGHRTGWLSVANPQQCKPPPPGERWQRGRWRRQQGRRRRQRGIHSLLPLHLTERQLSS